MNPSQAMNPGFRTPTKDDLYIAGMGIQDDASFASFSFAASFVDPAFTQNFAAYAVQHGGIPLRIHKSGPEGSFIAPLRERGVEVVEVSSADVSQATGQLIDAVNAGALRHLGQPSLDIAVKGTVLRTGTDGAAIWSQRNSQTEITALMACTVALGGVPDAWGEEPRILF